MTIRNQFFAFFILLLCAYNSWSAERTEKNNEQAWRPPLWFCEYLEGKHEERTEELRQKLPPEVFKHIQGFRQQEMRKQKRYELSSIAQLPTWMIRVMSDLLEQKEKDTSSGKVKKLLLKEVDSDLAYELSKSTNVKLVNNKDEAELQIYYSGNLEKIGASLLESTNYHAIISKLQKGWIKTSPESHCPPFLPLYLNKNGNSTHYFIVKPVPKNTVSDDILLNCIARKLKLKLHINDMWHKKNKPCSNDHNDVYCWIEKEEYDNVIFQLELEVTENKDALAQQSSEEISRINTYHGHMEASLGMPPNFDKFKELQNHFK